MINYMCAIDCVRGRGVRILRGHPLRSALPVFYMHVQNLKNGNHQKEEEKPFQR